MSKAHILKLLCNCNLNENIKHFYRIPIYKIYEYLLKIRRGGRASSPNRIFIIYFSLGQILNVDELIKLKIGSSVKLRISAERHSRLIASFIRCNRVVLLIKDRTTFYLSRINH